MDNPDTVVLVHGTGAAAHEDVGVRWWQNGSDYCSDLCQRLGALARCVESGEVFHWSGANSESERHKASLELLESWLLRFEAEQRPYHLIGHSHGGSVIWGALRESIRRGKPLQHLATWSTVGTPFLHYRARRSDWLFVIPLIVGASLLGPLPQWSLTAWKHADEMMADGNFASLIALTLLSAVAVTALLYLARRVAVTLLVAQRVASGRRTEHRAMAIYGPRWLGLWSEDDEAINGLKNSVGFDARFSPQLVRPREAAGLMLRLLWFPICVVGWCYDAFVSRPIDMFVSDRIARRLQGNNLAARVLTAVTPAPIFDCHCDPLSGEMGRALTEQADAHAATTLRKIRQAFGVTAGTGEDTPVVMGNIARQLTFQELVHTSYFDFPEIRALLAEHIIHHRGVLKSDAAAACEPSLSHNEMAPTVSGDPRLERGRRGILAASAIKVALVLVPLIVVWVSAKAIYGAVLEYTDSYNVDLVLRDASINQVKRDQSANDDEKERAIREWLTALVATGRSAAAVATLSQPLHSGTADDDMPSLWIAAALAKAGHWDDARRIATPVTNAWGASFRRVVRYLVEHGELDVARFMAGLIPSPNDRLSPLSEVALAYARAGQLEKSVDVMPPDAGTDQLAALAKILGESGNADLALHVGRLISWGGSRASTLIAIAKILRHSRPGDAESIADEALASAIETDHAKDNLNPGDPLAQVAVSFSEAGFARQSLAALDEIDNSTPYAVERRQGALRKVAVALAEMGMVEAARGAVGQITNPDDKDFAYHDVASALASLGRAADAIETTRLIKSAYFQDSALGKVAPALAKSGLVDAALESTAEIKSTYQRIDALNDVASGLIDSGKQQFAKSVIDKALEQLAAEDEIQKFSHLPDFAKLLRRLGKEKDALQAARDAVSAARRYRAKKADYDDTLLARAGSLYDAGFAEEAFALSELIKDDAREPINARKTAPKAGTATLDDRIAAWRARPPSPEKDAEAESIADKLVSIGQAARLVELASLVLEDSLHDKLLLSALRDGNHTPPSIALSLMLVVHAPEWRCGGILRVVGAGGLDKSEARKALNQVSNDVDTVVDIGEKTFLFGMLAEQYAHIGEFRRARQFAQRSAPVAKLIAYSAILNESAKRN
jgi:tetratricopeptide (TPR) repeat protein